MKGLYGFIVTGRPHKSLDVYHGLDQFVLRKSIGPLCRLHALPIVPASLFGKHHLIVLGVAFYIMKATDRKLPLTITP